MGGIGARIRLARFGKRNAPFYNIVVIDGRKARNAKPIEVLGTYDPVPKRPLYGDGRPAKDIRIDLSRARYWLGVGAQPSDTMWRLLSMAGLLAPKFRPAEHLSTNPILKKDAEAADAMAAEEIPKETKGGKTEAVQAALQEEKS